MQMFDPYQEWDYYHTRKFKDIYPDFKDFENDYNTIPASMKVVESNDLETIYFLLLGNYGNSHIQNSSEGQFKYKLFSLIFMYAPIWVKKTEIQKKIRELDLNGEDVLRGTKTVYNHASNDGGDPENDNVDSLKYIDSQSTTNIKYTKLDAWAKLYDVLSNDVTKQFMNKFKNLFIYIVESQSPKVYY